jgi:V-type H+-transporting ATPase subunit d
LKINVDFLASYFADCISAEDLDDLNIEIIRNTLYKSYLEDFYRFCENNLNAESYGFMKELLYLEADQRAISITLNSLGTDLNKTERLSLYPRIGYLYPEEHRFLACIDEAEDIKPIIARYPVNYLHIMRLPCC